MRIGRVVGALCLAPMVCVASCAAAGASDASALGWLEGSWRGSADGVETEEIWSSAAGGALVGANKSVRGGRMVSFELLRIVPVEDGTLAYVAAPSGGPATTFRLKELGERRVVFENLEHDFPQRIVYALAADGALNARVEGLLDGKLEAMEWTWRRN